MKITMSFILKMIILFLFSMLTACAGNTGLSSENSVSTIATDVSRIEGKLVNIDGNEMVIQQSDKLVAPLRATQNDIPSCNVNLLNTNLGPSIFYKINNHRQNF